MGHVNRPRNASTALLASTALNSGTLGYGTTTRSGTGATYTDQYGTVQSAPANTPRINNSTRTGTNLFRNPRFVGAVVGVTASSIATYGHSVATGLSAIVVGKGTLTSGPAAGLDYIDIRISGDNVTNTTLLYQMYPEGSTYPPATTGDVFTISAYFQVVAGTIPQTSTPIMPGFDERVGGAHATYNFSSTGLVGALSTTMQRISRTATVGTVNTSQISPGWWFNCATGTASADYTIRIAGWQLEPGSTASTVSYPSPGTLAVSQNYAPPRLLAEEARVNSVRNPRAEGSTVGIIGSGGVAPTNWSITPGVSGLNARLVGTGTEFGMSYVDVRFDGTTTAGGNCNIYFESPTGVAAVQNQVWTTSVYARLVGGSYANVNTPSIIHDENTAGGSYVTGGSTALTQFTPALARYTGTRTIADPTTGVYRSYIAHGISGAGLAVDITVRVYGPQMEQGSFATSLILPPAGSPAATTRQGDDIVIPTTGRLQYAASVTNKLVYSQAFDNAAWTKVGSSITADVATPTAPDGGTTADKLIEDTSTGNHRADQPVSIAAGWTTISVFVSAAERTAIALQWDGTLNGVSSGSNASYNVSTGTIITPAASNGNILTPTASIVPATGTWYRCSLTFYSAYAGSGTMRVFLHNGTTSNYTGDVSGTFGAYLWGAQFENTPVTPAANLLSAPESFDGSQWTKSGSTVVANATNAPDGTLSADKLTEDTSNGPHITTQAYTVPTAGQYTIKCYAKAAERTQVIVKAFNATDGNAMIVWVDLTNGTTFNNTTGVVTVTAVGNGWYRITCTATVSAVYTQWIIGTVAGGTDSFTGAAGAGVHIWGALLTRGGVVDYVTVNQLTSPPLFSGASPGTKTRLASGTIVARVKVPTAGPTNPAGIAALTEGTSALRAGLRFNIVNNNLTLFSFGHFNAVLSVSIGGTPAPGTVITVAFTWSNGSMAAAYGGQYMALGLPPQLGMVDLRLGSSSVGGQWLNSELESVYYYPYRMSYAQLLAATT